MSVKFSFSILKAVIIAPVVKALNPSVTVYYINRREKNSCWRDQNMIPEADFTLTNLVTAYSI